MLLAGDLVAMFVLFVIRGRLVPEPDQPIQTGRRRRAVALLASRQLSGWPAAAVITLERTSSSMIGCVRGR